MKAQDILSHCKDIVIGKTPHPELMRVEVINDYDCRIYYKDSTQVVWAFNLDSSEAHLAVAARLLGLPAPVVLEWVKEKNGEFKAVYNNHICAEIFPSQSRNQTGLWDAGVRISGRMPYCRSKLTFEDAKRLCASDITKIITPTK